MVSCFRFVFEFFFPNIQLPLKTRTYCIVDFIVFRFCETFTVINSVTRILLIETLYEFRTLVL